MTDSFAEPTKRITFVTDLVRIADLFHPPNDFVLPRDAPDATRFARPFGHNIFNYWQAAPRADWMVWVAGWSRVETRAVVSGLVACARLQARLLPEHDDGWRALQDIEAWVKGGVLRPKEVGFFPSEGPQGSEYVQNALAELSQISRLGERLGPSQPILYQSVLTWLARAESPALPLANLDPVPFLQKAADVLRACVEPEDLRWARLPHRMPASWAEAKEAWPTLVRSH